MVTIVSLLVGPIGSTICSSLWTTAELKTSEMSEPNSLKYLLAKISTYTVNPNSRPASSWHKSGHVNDTSMATSLYDMHISQQTKENDWSVHVSILGLYCTNVLQSAEFIIEIIFVPLQTIADVIRTCLGPRSMLKVSGQNHLSISRYALLFIFSGWQWHQCSLAVDVTSSNQNQTFVLLLLYCTSYICRLYVENYQTV